MSFTLCSNQLYTYQPPLLLSRFYSISYPESSGALVSGVMPEGSGDIKSRPLLLVGALQICQENKFLLPFLKRQSMDGIVVFKLFTVFANSFYVMWKQTAFIQTTAMYCTFRNSQEPLPLPLLLILLRQNPQHSGF